MPQPADVSIGIKLSRPSGAMTLPRFVVLLACAAMMMATSAAGAVRVCKPMQLGEVASNANERAARTRAMQNWMGKARAFGEGFTAWRLAIQRSLQCKSSADGFRCAAAGRPCRIFQKVPRR